MQSKQRTLPSVSSAALCWQWHCFEWVLHGPAGCSRCQFSCPAHRGQLVTVSIVQPGAGACGLDRGQPQEKPSLSLPTQNRSWYVNKGSHSITDHMPVAGQTLVSPLEQSSHWLSALTEGFRQSALVPSANINPPTPVTNLVMPPCAHSPHSKQV